MPELRQNNLKHPPQQNPGQGQQTRAIQTQRPVKTGFTVIHNAIMNRAASSRPLNPKITDDDKIPANSLHCIALYKSEFKHNTTHCPRECTRTEEPINCVSRLNLKRTHHES
jgi:hypothetical protein